jgi:hypothetical protein
MTGLKNYEERAFPQATTTDSYEQEDGATYIPLKVDEADSIKKLIENISAMKKWPNRTRTKNSGIPQFRRSCDSVMKLPKNCWEGHSNRLLRGLTNSKEL